MGDAETLRGLNSGPVSLLQRGGDRQYVQNLLTHVLRPPKRDSRMV